MKFIHRLGFYLGGFAVGLVLLAFIFSGKKTSCDYGLDARVMKNIRNKPMTISEEIAEKLEDYQLDSLAIRSILTYGDVNFSKSNTKTRKDTCKTYFIEGKHNDREIFLTFANCELRAQLLKVDRK